MASPPPRPSERLSEKLRVAAGAPLAAASSSPVPKWDGPLRPADHSEVPAITAGAPVGAALPSDRGGFSSPPSHQLAPFGASAGPTAARASAFDSTDSGRRVATGSQPATPNESAKNPAPPSNSRLPPGDVQAPAPLSEGILPLAGPTPLAPLSCGGGGTGRAAAAASDENPPETKRRRTLSESMPHSSSSASPLHPGPDPQPLHVLPKLSKSA